MREGVRRLSDSALDLAGALLILLIVGLGALGVWQGYQHNQDLATIKTLTQQTKTLTAKTDHVSKLYLAEQTQLAQAGKEQVTFAIWLVEAQASLCSAVHATCPAIPSFTGVNSR